MEGEGWQGDGWEYIWLIIIALEIVAWLALGIKAAVTILTFLIIVFVVGVLAIDSIQEFVRNLEAD